MILTKVDVQVTCMLLIVFITIANSQRNEQYCLAEDGEPSLRFSSKTAYEFVYGKEKHQPIPYCKPRQVWLLARHGTRLPSKTEIQNLQNLIFLRNQIVRNHDERHLGSLCHDDIENLKKWQYNLTEDAQKNLTIQGWNENKFFALRLKSNFRELLDIPYSREKFEVVTTSTSRSKLSCQAFMAGMFGFEGDNGLFEPTVNHSVIKVYKECPAWKDQIDDNPEAFKELTLFKESPFMKEVIHNVSQRLGFAHNLTFLDLHNMYMMCAYMKSWDYYSISPWCAVFKKDEMKVMEYVRDLWYYYKSSYGHDINLKVGCPAVRDMMERFTRIANNEGSEPNGVFYFSHTTAINTMISRLGLAKDPYKLTHENYFNVSKRKFQTSLIGPFLSNLQAIFYKCTEGEENRVLFYLNERPVSYEGCSVGLCSFSYLKQKLKTIVDPATCNDKFCYTDASNNLSLHSSLLTISLLCTFYSIIL